MRNREKELSLTLTRRDFLRAAGIALASTFIGRELGTNINPEEKSLQQSFGQDGLLEAKQVKLAFRQTLVDSKTLWESMDNQTKGTAGGFLSGLTLAVVEYMAEELRRTPLEKGLRILGIEGTPKKGYEIINIGKIQALKWLDSFYPHNNINQRKIMCLTKAERFDEIPFMRSWGAKLAVILSPTDKVDPIEGGLWADRLLNWVMVVSRDFRVGILTTDSAEEFRNCLSAAGLSNLAEAIDFRYSRQSTPAWVTSPIKGLPQGVVPH